MSRDVYAEVTFKILDQLEQGTVPWKRPWRTPIGAHRNLQSGRPYRGINQLLLSISPYQQPYWTTFKAMAKAGGKLRTDEGKQESTMVVLWKRIFAACKDPACSECHGNGKKHRLVLLLRYYNVFNVEQTTLDVPPEKEPEHDFSPDEYAESVFEDYIERSEVHFRSTANPRAYYSPSLDMVHVPGSDAFTSTAGYYNTVFHEFGHSTGHKDRLARKGIMEVNQFGDDDYSDEELVAEMTAAMVLAEVGLFDDQAMNQSAAYIDHWRQKLSEDVKLIVMAAARAQRAADLIMGREFEQSAAQEQRETGEAVT